MTTADRLNIIILSLNLASFGVLERLKGGHVIYFGAISNPTIYHKISSAIISLYLSYIAKRYFKQVKMSNELNVAVLIVDDRIAKIYTAALWLSLSFPGPDIGHEDNEICINPLGTLVSV